jgi:hypothetical protein
MACELAQQVLGALATTVTGTLLPLRRRVVHHLSDSSHPNQPAR